MELHLNPSDVLYLAGTCESCKAEFETPHKSMRHNTDVSAGECGICNKEYCSECRYWCDCCDKIVCKGCTTRCVKCGEYTCNRCITNSACAFCADDEDSRIAAIAASNTAAYDSISRFHNFTWLCLSALLLGVVTGLVYQAMQKGGQ
jgi:hypothetical protein